MRLFRSLLLGASPLAKSAVFSKRKKNKINVAILRKKDKI